jgi:hypothetical protein
MLDASVITLADVAARKAKALRTRRPNTTGYPLKDALRAKKQAKRLATAGVRKGKADVAFVKRKAASAHRRRPHL